MSRLLHQIGFAIGFCRNIIGIGIQDNDFNFMDIMKQVFDLQVLIKIVLSKLKMKYFLYIFFEIIDFFCSYDVWTNLHGFLPFLKGKQLLWLPLHPWEVKPFLLGVNS